jgi:hypothetical protein
VYIFPPRVPVKPLVGVPDVSSHLPTPYPDAGQLLAGGCGLMAFKAMMGATAGQERERGKVLIPQLGTSPKRVQGCRCRG